MTEGTGPFRVMLRMQIHPGMEEEFEQTWLATGRAITDHPSNLGQWLSKSAEEVAVYYIVSDWIDEPRFRAYEHSERHLAHRTKLHPFRSSGSMTTMHVVYGTPGLNGMPGLGRSSPASSRVRVLVYARAPGSHPAAVAETYHQISRELAETPGMISNELLRSTSDPRGFVVMSEWESLAAFHAWELRPEHRVLTAPLRPLHDREPAIPFGIYEVTAAYGPEGVQPPELT